MLWPAPEQYNTWQEWGAKVIQRLTEPKQNNPQPLPRFPIEQLPSANVDGMLVWVTNDVNGAQPVYSQNNNWYRFDGTLTSTT